MIRLFSCVMGSVDSSPYIPRSKCIDPVLTPAIITAGANVLGNVLGFGSQISANSTNLKIARETNAQNYKMFQEQLAYNEDMWNKQNEYNDPKNQAQRLLAAGINPATVFGNGAITPAGQLVAPQAPQLQGAHVNPYNFDLSGIGQAANAFFQNQLLGKEAESKGLDNQAKQIDLQFKVSRILLDMKEQIGRIDKMLAETGKTKVERDFLLTQKRDLENHVKLFEENYEYLSEREKLQNDVMKAQQGNLLADSTYKRAMTQFQNLVTAYYPEMAQSQIGLMSAQAGEAIRSAEALVQQGKLSSQKACTEYVDRQLKKLLFKQENRKDYHEQGKGNRILKEVRGFADYLSGIIFGNLKIFK